MIQISQVELGEEAEALVLEVIRSGHLAQGPMVAALEDAFRRLVGVEHAVAVSSGTTALVAALEALHLAPGDEVLTSPFTFAATLNAILESGATARFADIGDDFNVDPGRLEGAVSDRTRVLMPVHLYGYPADMTAIARLAVARHLEVVEDAAQAHGAVVDGRPVGSFGIGCFSLYATKNVTTGEGGVITTNDAGLADRIRVLRNQGMRARYQYEVPGHNYRMTDLQAALALPQLDRLDGITQRRRDNAAALTAGLVGVPGLVTPAEAAGRTHVYHQYTIRVTRGAALDRDGLAAALEQAGIRTGVYYPRVVFDYECYREHPRVLTDPVPVARRMADEVLSLPVHPHLSEADLERIVTTVREALDA